MLQVESFGVIPFTKSARGEWQVLLILHSKGRHWGFPKGKPDARETPIETAKRELKEETGLEISQLLTQDPLIEKYQFLHQRNPIVKTVFYFPAVVKGELKLQEEEVRDARWLPLSQALSLLTFKDARQILSDSSSFLDSLC